MFLTVLWPNKRVYHRAQNGETQIGNVTLEKSISRNICTSSSSSSSSVSFPFAFQRRVLGPSSEVNICTLILMLDRITDLMDSGRSCLVAFLLLYPRLKEYPVAINGKLKI